MKKKLIDVFLMALLFTVTIGSVVSCKDYEEDSISDLRGNIETVSDAINFELDALKERVKILEDAKETMQDEINTLRGELGNANDAPDVNTIYGRIASLEAAVDGINESIKEINETLNSKVDVSTFKELQDKVAAIEGGLKGLEEYISQITSNTKAIEGLTDDISVLKNDMLEVKKEAAAALKLAQANEKRIEDLESMLTDYADFKANVEQALKNAEGEYVNITETLNNMQDEINTSVDQKFEDLKEEYDAVNDEFKEELDSLKTSIEDLRTEIKNEIDAINTRLGLVESALNQYISSVIIQGTENPVYGTFALPVGVSSNVLAAYYGTMDLDMQFPATYEMYPNNYVFSKDGTGKTLTAKDLEMLGINNIIVAEAKGNRVIAGWDYEAGKEAAGNAGTLYLTVNPISDINHTGAKPTLENSAGTASKVALSPLEESYKVLNFGYTRSQANGFYESKATVYKDFIDDVKPRVTYEDLKDLASTAKDVVNDARYGRGINLSALVSDLYAITSDILDANAVKFSWTDALKNSRSVMSKYELAATAIKPLSYNFWINANYQSIPGVGHVENIIGKVFDKVRDALPEVPENVNIEITFDGVSLREDGSVIVNANVPGQRIDTGSKDADGNTIYVDVEQTKVEIDITKQVNDILKDVNTSLEDMIADLNDQIGEINELLESLQSINDLGSTLDDVEQQIYDYLKKGEDVVLRYINNANKLLQPVMLTKTTESFITFSNTVSAPTKLSAATAANGFTIYPTSYSAEILAPAYKKLVGITNVYKTGHSANAQDGDSACKTQLDKVNKSENFGKVIDGSIFKLQLEGAEQGYIYELTYAAVDYRGRIVVKKVYFELV